MWAKHFLTSFKTGSAGYNKNVTSPGADRVPGQWLPSSGEWLVRPDNSPGDFLINFRGSGVFFGLATVACANVEASPLRFADTDLESKKTPDPFKRA